MENQEPAILNSNSGPFGWAGPGIFEKSKTSPADEYLFKFKLYCLINSDQKEQAQLIYDLRKELGFEDEYFEKKINYLLDLTEEMPEEISENSILDFHLAHRTNPNFTFEPNQNTSKIICLILSFFTKA